MMDAGLEPFTFGPPWVYLAGIMDCWLNQTQAC